MPSDVVITGFSLDEKLEAVEAAIVDLRAAARAGGPRRTYDALRAVAIDLRAARSATGADGGHIFQVLKGQIERARRSKARLGYLEDGHRLALAEALLAHWPAIAEAFRRAITAEELSAERDMYQMMVHDVTAPAIVEEIRRRFPTVAERWSKSNGEMA